MDFVTLLEKRRGAEWKPPRRLLALDPGHTTGWSLFVDGKLERSGQVKSLEEGWRSLDSLFIDTNPTAVVFENYRVYEHKLSRHANSEVYTLRLIGAIEYVCERRLLVPAYNMMASQHKGFCTDERLKQWGMYVKGQRHARDSIRLGIYFLLFDSSIQNQ